MERHLLQTAMGYNRASALVAIGTTSRCFWLPPKPAPTATAVLVQPNLNVSGDNRWLHPGEWEQHIADFKRLAGEQCKTYIAGIPQTGAPAGEIVCPPYPTHPDLIVWPESPAPFLEHDPRFQPAMHAVAQRRKRRSSSAAWAWILRRGRARPGAATTRRWSSARMARPWAATTRSTSSPSASTFPSRNCSSLPARSPAMSARWAAERAQGLPPQWPSLRRLHLTASTMI